MNVELNDFAVAIMALTAITGMAIRHRRRLLVRVSPKSLEVDLQQQEIQVAEAGLEPARGLPPTGF
jgi:hypothetical protein